LTRTVSEVLGDRVAFYRRRAAPTAAELDARSSPQRHRPGLTQDELSARVAALGFELSRVAIANIESAGRPDSANKNKSRADAATVTDFLALAIALDVPPPLLLAPLGDEEEVQIGTLTFHPHLLVDWLAGETNPAPLPENMGFGRSAWFDNSERLRDFRELRRLQDQCHSAESRLATAEERGDDAEVTAARRAFDRRLRDIYRLTVSMERAGTTTPELPAGWADRMEELRHLPEED